MIPDVGLPIGIPSFCSYNLLLNWKLILVHYGFNYFDYILNLHALLRASIVPSISKSNENLTRMLRVFFENRHFKENPSTSTL